MLDRQHASKSNDELVEKIVELQSRLDEAEETLKAIQNGEIDAFVTFQGSDGPKVYTLESADYLYRALVQDMSEGVATLTYDGTIFYSNAQLAFILQVPLEEITGQILNDFIHQEDLETYQAIFEKGLKTSGKGEIRIKSVDGTAIPVHISINSLKDLNGVYVIITDLSDQKHHEELKSAHEQLNKTLEALRESEARFRSVLDNSQDVIYRMNVQTGFYEYMSPAIRALGFEPEEMMAMSNDEVLSRVHPNDRPALLSVLSQINQTGKGVAEYRFRGNDDIYRWWSNQMVIIKDSEDKPLYRDGSVRDVTDRQKVDEELRLINIELSEITADLQTILDIAPIVIWIANDPECLNITGNAYADEIMHVHRGGNISLSAPIEDQTVSYKVFQNGIELNSDELPAQMAASTGEPVKESELDLVFSDGRIVKLLLGAVPLFDNDGKVRGAIAAGMDITHYKLIEDSLRESEERLRLAQISGNVGVWDWNTVTDELNFTPELERLYGLSPGTIKKYQDWRQLTHPDDIEKVEAERDDKIAKHEPFDLEFRIFHKSSDTRWLSARGGAMYNEEGDVVRVLGINIDITERKQVEEQVKIRTEELAKSNADLKQFAYVASHDLREPLRMITSFLQLLERRYKDQLDQDANEFISFAVDGAKRLDNMIMDLLEYSKVANREMQFSDVNIQDVIDQVITNLVVLIDDNSATITFDSLPIIRGDENQMVILLQNLISNAIKYRRTEKPQIHISAMIEDNQYVFSVKDNGIGIDPEHLERIFTIFKRLHNHEEYEGSGIGLAIAQRIVHQHGGKIWAESEPGIGSTFHFTIPT